jgi:hypothetical protein
LKNAVKYFKKASHKCAETNFRVFLIGGGGGGVELGKNVRVLCIEDVWDLAKRATGGVRQRLTATATVRYREATPSDASIYEKENHVKVEN